MEPTKQTEALKTDAHYFSMGGKKRPITESKEYWLFVIKTIFSSRRHFLGVK
jgi:hypothetical protein